MQGTENLVSRNITDIVESRFLQPSRETKIGSENRESRIREKICSEANPREMTFRSHVQD